tara:strand:- start:46 stop:261 length:216 start_codon:yes stop_codon:yes gene_type:complete
MKNKIILVNLSLVFLFLSETSVYAYLDPGAGSIILQALIAAIALIGTYFSFYWKKVKDFFKKLSKKKPEKD